MFTTMDGNCCLTKRDRCLFRLFFFVFLFVLEEKEKMLHLSVNSLMNIVFYREMSSVLCFNFMKCESCESTKVPLLYYTMWLFSFSETPKNWRNNWRFTNKKKQSLHIVLPITDVLFILRTLVSHDKFHTTQHKQKTRTLISMDAIWRCVLKLFIWVLDFRAHWTSEKHTSLWLKHLLSSLVPTIWEPYSSFKLLARQSLISS